MKVSFTCTYKKKVSFTCFNLKLDKINFWREMRTWILSFLFSFNEKKKVWQGKEPYLICKNRCNSSLSTHLTHIANLFFLMSANFYRCRLEGQSGICAIFLDTIEKHLLYPILSSGFGTFTMVSVESLSMFIYARCDQILVVLSPLHL